MEDLVALMTTNHERDRVMDVVCATLDRNNVRYDQDREKKVVNFRMDNHQCRIFMSPHSVVIVIEVDGLVREDRRMAVAKLLCKINVRLDVGCWELDNNDGEVRFRACLGFRRIMETKISETFWILYHVAFRTFLHSHMAVWNCAAGSDDEDLQPFEAIIRGAEH